MTEDQQDALDVFMRRGGCPPLVEKAIVALMAESREKGDRRRGRQPAMIRFDYCDVDRLPNGKPDKTDPVFLRASRIEAFHAHGSFPDVLWLYLTSGAKVAVWNNDGLVDKLLKVLDGGDDD